MAECSEKLTHFHPMMVANVSLMLRKTIILGNLYNREEMKTTSVRQKLKAFFADILSKYNMMIQPMMYQFATIRGYVETEQDERLKDYTIEVLSMIQNMMVGTCTYPTLVGDSTSLTIVQTTNLLHDFAHVVFMGYALQSFVEKTKNMLPTELVSTFYSVFDVFLTPTTRQFNIRNPVVMSLQKVVISTNTFMGAALAANQCILSEDEGMPKLAYLASVKTLHDIKQVNNAKKNEDNMKINN